jgi:hypothetical protein
MPQLEARDVLVVVVAVVDPVFELDPELVVELFCEEALEFEVLDEEVLDVSDELVVALELLVDEEELVLEVGLATFGWSVYHWFKISSNL